MDEYIRRVLKKPIRLPDYKYIDNNGNEKIGKIGMHCFDERQIEMRISADGWSYEVLVGKDRLDNEFLFIQSMNIGCYITDLNAVWCNIDSMYYYTDLEPGNIYAIAYGLAHARHWIDAHNTRISTHSI